jgi:WD40 repeat protein
MYCCSSSSRSSSCGCSDTHIAIAFSPDGDTLTTVVANASVSRWNVTDPHAVTRLSVHTRQTLGSGDVAFGPDGRALAGAAADGSDAISLWNTWLPDN